MHLRAPHPTHTVTRNVPGIFGFGYAGSCQSAMDVGGDFFDVLPISDGSVLMAVADVMGKGPGAALFAGTLRTLLRALVEPNLCPARVLSELNELLFDQLSSADIFITLQLAVADLHRRELHVANAGHCPLLISAPQRPTRVVAPDGMPLGICPEAVFMSESVAIEPLASVLLYTDGVTEARNIAGTFFGQSRLEWWLGQAVERSSTARQLKRSLLLELATFQGGSGATDDQTFLILADETPRPVEADPRDNQGWFLPWTQPNPSYAHSI